MVQESGQSDQQSWIRRVDQLIVGIVIGIALVLIGGYWWKKVGSSGRTIDVERDVRFQIDLNSADWPELMVLPDLGETRARNIVAWRREHGRFATHEDVLAIPGIGEKTLERIRPYLRPIPRPRDDVGT